MKTIPQWLMRFFAWRSSQPAEIRWLCAFLLFLAAFLGRLLLGRMHGANPALVFYPALLLTTVFFGWQQAIVSLCLAVGVGLYLFIPTSQFMMPFGWVVVGGLNIATVAVLDHVVRELIAAEERQQVLFQRLQDRVESMPPHPAVQKLDRLRRRLTDEPEDLSAAERQTRRL